MNHTFNKLFEILMDLCSRFLQERRVPRHKVCVVLNKRIVTDFKSPCLPRRSP